MKARIERDQRSFQKVCERERERARVGVSVLFVCSFVFQKAITEKKDDRRSVQWDKKTGARKKKIIRDLLIDR